jgi:hypothetical protein
MEMEAKSRKKPNEKAESRNPKKEKPAERKELRGKSFCWAPTCSSDNLLGVVNRATCLPA